VVALARHYTPDYSRNLGRESRRTAAVVAPMVMDLLGPDSVVDLGCGTGGWLAEFQLAGVHEILGIDGAWIERDDLEIPVKQFRVADLTRPFELGRRFALACSIEVAEHLPASSAPTFIASLASLAPAVLFSAAIPFQGGTRHLNEQWADYWQALFAQHDFVALDFFRWRLWDNPEVQPYVAQNLWLYIAPSLLKNDRIEAERVSKFPVRAVHPGVFQVPSARRLFKLLRRRK
jgi:SAM-dependent methyltransferase